MSKKQGFKYTPNTNIPYCGYQVSFHIDENGLAHFWDLPASGYTFFIENNIITLEENDSQKVIQSFDEESTGLDFISAMFSKELVQIKNGKICFNKVPECAA